MNQLAIAFLTGLAIFGLIELISYLCRVLYGKRKQEEFIVVLPLKGDAPELELSVRRIQHERNWHYQTDCTIYLVDMGMTQESKKIATLLQREIDGIYFCDESDLLKQLQENVCLQS